MIGRHHFDWRRLLDRCPADWMLTRHVSGEAPDGGLERHLVRCARCSNECASLRRLVTQAQGLTSPAEMDEATRRAIAARLLTTGPAPRTGPPMQRILMAAASSALILALVLGARHRRQAPAGSGVTRADQTATADTPAATASRRSRAAIRAIGAAHFTRAQPLPDEVIRVDDGTIVLEVEPLAAGERFRVRTDDGEVEVRGTRFQVSASQKKLTAVSVSKGRVEVRSPGGGHVVLDPGDEWTRDTEPEQAEMARTQGPAESHAAPAPGATRAALLRVTPPATPADSRRPKARAVRRSIESPLPRQETRTSFERAWSLLRQGDAGRAAELFADIERTAGDREIAEDALYWRAVATAKKGDRGQAQSLFERFLRRFPVSPRIGEAASSLGWLYVESGQMDEARRAFQRAEDDPSPAVRASARDGLRRTVGP